MAGIGKFRVSLRKSLIYLIFGIGAFFLGFIILPLERLFIRSERRFRNAGRRSVNLSHRLVVWVCRVLGLIRIEGPVPDFSDTGGKIIAPNHPSLLDVVILFSLIPGANCIVRGGLLHTVVGSIVRVLYIANNEDIDELKKECAESLARKEPLIVFPEGTRSKKGVPVTIKRGVACISLFADAPVIPLYIGGNDKEGLRKGDPFWRINGDGFYSYTFTRGEEILPSGIEGKTMREKSIKMTELLEDLYRRNTG